MRAWIRFPTSGCKLRALDFSSVEALPRSPKITMDHFAKVGEGGAAYLLQRIDSEGACLLSACVAETVARLRASQPPPPS